MVYDGENRLILAETRTDVRDNPLIANSAKKKFELAYDYQGRRIQQKEYQWDGASYALISTLKFVYDSATPNGSGGGNKIAVLDGNNNLVQSYMWGLDLSGSMQGAGGVGGLLFMKDVPSGTGHFYAYNGNGDVVALINADTGEVSAEYESGPFAELIRTTGAAAEFNHFIYSTKWKDAIGSDYGYRILRDGRWLGRDSAGEDVGVNLYAFLGNDGLNQVDVLGRFSWTDGLNTRFPTAVEWTAIRASRERVHTRTVNHRRVIQQYLATHKLEDRNVDLRPLSDLGAFDLFEHRDKCKLKKALNKIDDNMNKVGSIRTFTNISIIRSLFCAPFGFRFLEGLTVGNEIKLCEDVLLDTNQNLDNIVGHEASHICCKYQGFLLWLE